MEESDRLLWEHAVQRDRQAWRQLVRKYTPMLQQRLRGKIPRRFQSVLSTEDVLQQTYMDAFLEMARLGPEGVHSPTALLTTLANHNLSDALRILEADKRGGEHRGIELRSREGASTLLYERLLVDDNAPSRAYAHREACAAVEAALRQLPRHYAQVVQMYDLEGRPVEEVGEAVRRGPGAVFMVRARAHRLLRELLGSAPAHIATT